MLTDAQMKQIEQMTIRMQEALRILTEKKLEKLTTMCPTQHDADVLREADLPEILVKYL